MTTGVRHYGSKQHRGEVSLVALSESNLATRHLTLRHGHTGLPEMR